MMDYKALAEVIRKFENVELLAAEIESLHENMIEVETVDNLTEFLEDELDYSCQ